MAPLDQLNPFDRAFTAWVVGIDLPDDADWRVSSQDEAAGEWEIKTDAFGGSIWRISADGTFERIDGDSAATAGVVAQRRRLRGYLDEIIDLAEHAGARGLTKAQTADVARKARTARAHLKSLEIAAGWRGIGAVLADDDDPRANPAMGA